MSESSKNTNMNKGNAQDLGIQSGASSYGDTGDSGDGAGRGGQGAETEETKSRGTPGRTGGHADAGSGHMDAASKPHGEGTRGTDVNTAGGGGSGQGVGKGSKNLQ
ncbi:hypothetical protein RvY_18232-2 [Ramazzottius varieornatus]|uniref:Uncharacterized protein n=1 Tax=Ramazzottius varieornatus TaxID=947166 RepID=A0A1D1W6Q1_RAMVA|nr:hypothetical protein RvY_18232-2 [Ramazzottius varieornatus]